MSSDDDVVVRPAAAAVPDVALDEDDVIVQPAGRRRGNPQGTAGACPRAGPRADKFGAWVVSQPRGPDVSEDGSVVAARRQVVGAMECEWEVVANSDDASSVHKRLCPRAPAPRSPPWAYLQYTVLRVWELEAPMIIDDNVDISGPVGAT